MKKFEDIEKQVIALEKQGGVTADDRMKLVDGITEVGDMVTGLFTRLTEIPDAEESPVGVLLEPLPDLTPNQMKALKVKHDISELRDIARKYGIEKYKTSTATSLINQLHAKGVIL